MMMMMMMSRRDEMMRCVLMAAFKISVFFLFLNSSLSIFFNSVFVQQFNGLFNDNNGLFNTNNKNSMNTLGDKRRERE